MIIKKRLLIIAILICTLIGIKLLRLLPLPGISIFWNLHIYFFILVGILAISNISIFFKNSLDKLIFTFLVMVSLLTVFRHLDAILINIVIYIIPIFAYYLLRNIYLTYEDLYKLFYIISGFLIILFFIDFFSNNIIHLHIFDYARFHEYSSSDGRTVALMNDAKTHPVFGDKFLRVGGVTFSPQPSAVLYASFSIFHFYIYKQTKSKQQLYTFFIYLIILFLYNSGTSIVVLVLLLILIRQSLLLNINLIIFSIPILLFLIILMYGNLNVALQTFELIFDGIYNVYLLPMVNMNELFFSSLLLGTGINDSGNIVKFNFEMDYLNLIFQLGSINIVVLMLIIAQARKYFFSLLKDGVDLMPFYYLMIGIIIGSMHYQSIFKYPNSMLLFGIMGIISRFYINNKRENIEKK